MSERSSKTALTPRQMGLAIALAATLAASLWVAQRDEELDEAPPLMPVRSARSAVTAVPPPVPSNWAKVARAPWPAASPAQLAAWGPPPPAPAAPPPQPSVAPAAPPMAPPFPYQLIGRLEQEGGVSQALLAAGNRSLNAKAGDVIDGQWRVERVDPSGLGLLWLPGQQPQTLTFRPILP